MKVYSIGRDVSCDIVINDSTDVISRRHAILNVAPSGKMTIVDQSHNGTYVNGIKISPNVPVPVTRKDNVSLAHVARLDWSQVPKPTNIAMYAIIGVIALAAIVLGIIFYINKTSEQPSQPVQTTAVDSTDTKKKEEVKKIEKEEEKPGKDAKEEAAAAEVEKTPTPAVKTCSTCGKPINKCQYKGKHPKPDTEKEPKKEPKEEPKEGFSRADR